MRAPRLGRVAFALAALALAPTAAQAAPIAFDMVGSTSQNLTSFVNPFNGAFASAADGFQKYQRFVSPSIPFSVLDDSLSIFPPDTLGIIGETNTDVFFGVVDTQNPSNSGPVSATWTFDVTGFHDLNLSIGMGAMGNFEASDSFQWTYQIDGGPVATAFASSVDEAGSQTYTLDGGAMFTLDDPMLADSTVLSNDLQTLSSNLSGTGASLSLTLTAEMDSGSEALAFQNIVIDGTPSPIVAFDMVGSASQNLTSFVNPFNGAFASAADGFQKYQRFVSPSIPFSVLDDSLSIFPPDTLGIIGETNTDVFFGVVDTQNPSNSGPVSASWGFDIAGFEDLELFIDMAAMGDFESSDFFQWTYQIDGGPSLTAFASSVDEAGSQTYTLEGGAMITLNDPMLMDGVLLSNLLQTFSTDLLGVGTTLLLTLTAQMDSGSEAIALQNIVIRGQRETPAVPEPTTLLLLGVGLAGLGFARKRLH